MVETNKECAGNQAETNFRFAPAKQGQTEDANAKSDKSGKRTFAQMSKNAPQDGRTNPLKKQKIGDQQMIQVEDPEKIVDAAEKSLEDLHKNDKEFFVSIKTDECKKATGQGVMSKKFGNHMRSFAATQALLAVKDPRLEMISDHFKDSNIFYNKRILDIGSHTGTMALQIGALYDPKLVIGCDIDSTLVKTSIENMHRVINDEATSLFLKQHLQDHEAAIGADASMLTPEEKERELKIQDLIQRTQELPKSLQLSLQGEMQFLGELKKQRQALQKPNKNQKNKPMAISHSQMKEHLYGRVNFKTENYVQDSEPKTVKQEQFDVILCLSTVKWIHLNFGDTGLKTLFLKAKEQLVPGGLLIIEPQPWKSYKKSKFNCKEFKDQVDKIQLKPHIFKSYLASIGLRHTDTIQAGDKNDKSLLVYRKE